MNSPRLQKIFSEFFKENSESLKAAQQSAQEEVTNLLEKHEIRVHTVSSRLKSLESAIKKMRDKKYRRITDLTDLIGVRVITYYRLDVDEAVRVLKDNLEVDLRRSVDKRQLLQDEPSKQYFGYRSVHLMCRLGKAQAARTLLGNRWFEIQIRSILEHAWAEIQHNIVYKSRFSFSDDFFRRFGSIAASLELLDREFQSLREEIYELVRSERSQIEEGRPSSRARFDMARLAATLEILRPDGEGWFGPSLNIPEGLETTCLDILLYFGISDFQKLKDVVETRKFKRLLSGYAALKGLSPTKVSHTAVCALAALSLDAKRVRRSFPELFNDPVISKLFEDNTRSASTD